MSPVDKSTGRVLKYLVLEVSMNEPTEEEIAEYEDHLWHDDRGLNPDCRHCNPALNRSQEALQAALQAWDRACKEG